jgi:integrase
MRSEQNRRIKLYRGTWCVVWRENGTTKRASLRTSDREQAERNFREYERQLKTNNVTINDAIDYWLEEKKHLKSYKISKAKFRCIRPFFGHLCPHHITRQLCREYAQSRDVSNTTIRNELAILRCAVNYHKKNNEAEFEFPPADPPKDHYLTREDYKRLLTATESPHIKLFMIVGLHTGARSNAILDLTWSQIDWDRLTINFIKGDHKNKRRSIIPINETLEHYLRQAYQGRTTEFVIEHGGKQIRSIRKGFAMTANRAGVKASPHVLRHTCAMVIAESGRPLQEVSQYLGHAGQTTTERVYAKFSPNHLREAAQALNDWHPCVLGSL